MSIPEGFKRDFPASEKGDVKFFAAGRRGDLGRTQKCGGERRRESQQSYLLLSLFSIRALQNMSFACRPFIRSFEIRTQYLRLAGRRRTRIFSRSVFSFSPFKIGFNSRILNEGFKFLTDWSFPS